LPNTSRETERERERERRWREREREREREMREIKVISGHGYYMSLMTLICL
jgi:hypothetical protein